MAGRPKKKPEYNPELQFNNFLQELRDAYEEADSLRSLADELNISLLKLRKLLITADVFTSDILSNRLHFSNILRGRCFVFVNPISALKRRWLLISRLRP